MKKGGLSDGFGGKDYGWKGVGRGLEVMESMMWEL